MAPLLVGGYKVGRDVEKIEPPQELRLPLMPAQIDAVYANALYDVLSNLSEDAPDLPGAIRWLEVAGRTASPSKLRRGSGAAGGVRCLVRRSRHEDDPHQGQRPA